MPDAPHFRELRGEYIEGRGQVTTPQEFLDYFEPLGHSLSQMPDGDGGPFVLHFNGNSAIGWVVSAAAKRRGGWRLWGMWTDEAIDPLLLPLAWPLLAEERRVPELIRVASSSNDIDFAVRDRALLAMHLARVWSHARDRHFEVEIDRSSLDILPWLYILGPVDPAGAQLLPSRFNGAGYQYILTNSADLDVEVPREIERLVDTAADDPFAAASLAASMRKKTQQRPEIHEMRAPSPRAVPPPRTRPAPAAPPKIWPLVRDAIVIALLAWIAFNVYQIRKHYPLAFPAPVTAAPAPVTETVAPPARSLADTLLTNPPQGLTIDPGIPRDRDGLARVAIEIFLRRNNCHARTEVVDGKFSAAEQRSIRRCAALTAQRLMTRDVEPNDERAIDWLERTVR